MPFDDPFPKSPRGCDPACGVRAPCGARGVRCVRIPSGKWWLALAAAILKGLGVRPGVPDVIAIKAGQAYAIELKAPGGRVTEAQRAAHAALRAAGAGVVVAYGLDDAIDHLERWKLVSGSSRRVGL
jgi:VRR-NUC domain